MVRRLSAWWLLLKQPPIPRIEAMKAYGEPKDAASGVYKRETSHALPKWCARTDDPRIAWWGEGGLEPAALLDILRRDGTVQLVKSPLEFTKLPIAWLVCIGQSSGSTSAVGRLQPTSARETGR